MPKTAAEIEKELVDLETKEATVEKKIKGTRIFFGVAIGLGVLTIIGLTIFSSINTAFILDDKQTIEDLKSKISELEKNAPNPTTGARITLSPEELKTIVALVCGASEDYLLLGSGVIWDPSGLIYTNKHVILNKDQVVDPKTICFVFETNDINKAAELKYTALPIRYSQNEDVATLAILGDADGNQIPGGKKFNTIKMGDSDPEALPTGAYVGVAGYPGVGGDSFTLTEGTVSGRFQGYIKTDAKINSGNSGGAALNIKKEYVGIPTLVLVNLRTSDELGYFIPINTVKGLKDWVKHEI